MFKPLLSAGLLNYSVCVWVSLSKWKLPESFYAYFLKDV